VTDELRFEAFVRAHATALLQAAVLLTGNRPDAEDLLQATLAHLYPRWARVAATEVPVAYVRRALVNRFISGRRDNRTVPMWDVPDLRNDADAGDSAAIKELVWALLGRLPERQRAALVLRYFYDCTDTQIAEELGCRAVTVRSILSRATSALRKQLVAAETMTAAAEAGSR